jgi:hypothetical protein
MPQASDRDQSGDQRTTTRGAGPMDPANQYDPAVTTTPSAG